MDWETGFCYNLGTGYNLRIHEFLMYSLFVFILSLKVSAIKLLLPCDKVAPDDCWVIIGGHFGDICHPSSHSRPPSKASKHFSQKFPYGRCQNLGASL